jgi:hypothetical protein
LTKKFAEFLASEYGVSGPHSFGKLGEAARNGWRAQYVRECAEDVLDDMSYLESTRLAAVLAAVFDAKDDRAKLAGYAALGKMIAEDEIIATRGALDDIRALCSPSTIDTVPK